MTGAMPCLARIRCPSNDNMKSAKHSAPDTAFCSTASPYSGPHRSAPGRVATSKPGTCLARRLRAVMQ